MRSLALTVCSLVVLAQPSTTRAQLVRRGDTVTASDVGPTKRLPAAAFDPVHGRWLVVWSLFPVAGRFVDREGTPLGSAFVIPETNPGGTISPRVVYAAELDAFLVAWIEEGSGAGRIAARLVRGDAAGNATFLGGEVTVSDSARPKHPESSPSVAWSGLSRTFLVTWSDQDGDLDVRIRRLDENAAPLGDEVPISSGEAFDAFPVVAHSPVANAWVVAWTYEPVTGGGAIATRAVSAGEGALGPEQVLYSSGYENYPDIAYDSRRDRFLVVSWHIAPEGVNDVWGRFADANAAPVGEVIMVAATADFEGGDGIGVAYSAAADGYVAVYQSTTMEIWGSLVSGDGAPGTKVELTTTARMGSYAPRIAGDDALPRWLVVTSHDFDRIAAQLVEAPAVPLPDGGVPGGDGGSGARDGAGPEVDGAARDGGRVRPPGEISSGCDCGVARRRGRAAVASSMAVFGVGLARLRRRRRRRST